MKAHVESYGCTLNRADSKIIEGILLEEGAELSSLDGADIIFLNTCAVKLPTERRMIARIRQLEKEGKRLVVCGCLPKMNLKEIRNASSCTVLDTNSLSKIPEILRGASGDFFSDTPEDKLGMPCASQGMIAAIPISAGCLGECAYCGVRNARGRLKSYAPKDVKSSVEAALINGAKEIQLTSQDCGVYGADIGASLPELLDEITATPGDFMVRIGMMNPGAALRILPELIDSYRSEKVYKFAHLPVQSGSDKVLEEMRRNYTVEEFMRVVQCFRHEFPDVCIATDVIVGYPTETRDDFLKTMSLLREARPDITNVSKFYPRPNTEAASLKKIGTQELKQRSTECAALAKSIVLEQNRRYMGRALRCLVTSKGSRGMLVARAPNYKKVLIPTGGIGTYCTAEMASAHATHIVGIIR